MIKMNYPNFLPPSDPKNGNVIQKDVPPSLVNLCLQNLSREAKILHCDQPICNTSLSQISLMQNDNQFSQKSEYINNELSFLIDVNNRTSHKAAYEEDFIVKDNMISSRHDKYSNTSGMLNQMHYNKDIGDKSNVKYIGKMQFVEKECLSQNYDKHINVCITKHLDDAHYNSDVSCVETVDNFAVNDYIIKENIEEVNSIPKCIIRDINRIKSESTVESEGKFDPVLNSNTLISVYENQIKHQRTRNAIDDINDKSSIEDSNKTDFDVENPLTSYYVDKCNYFVKNQIGGTNHDKNKSVLGDEENINCSENANGVASEPHIKIEDRNLIVNVNDESVIHENMKNIDFLEQDYLPFTDRQDFNNTVKRITNDVHDIGAKSTDESKGIIDFDAKNNVTFTKHERYIKTEATITQINVNDDNDKTVIESINKIDISVNDDASPCKIEEDMNNATYKTNEVRDIDNKFAVDNKAEVDLPSEINITLCHNETDLKILDATNNIDIEYKTNNSILENISRANVVNDNTTCRYRNKHFNNIYSKDRVLQLNIVDDKSVSDNRGRRNIYKNNMTRRYNLRNIVHTTEEVAQMHTVVNESVFRNKGRHDVKCRRYRNKHLKNVSRKNEIPQLNIASKSAFIEDRGTNAVVNDKRSLKYGNKHLNSVRTRKRVTQINIDKDKSSAENLQKSKFPVKDNMIANKKSEIKDKTKIIIREIYKSPYLKYMTTYAGYLQKSIKSENQAIKAHNCQKDKKETLPSSNIKTRKYVDNKAKKHFECPHCIYRASQAVHLRRHIIAVHERKKTLKCAKCNYSTYDVDNLRKHIDAVHEKKRPHKCPECYYRTAFTCNLRRHINDIHKEIKPYKCPKCDHKASTERAIQMHMNAIHDGIKPYQCSKCDYKASYPTTLRKHKAKYHAKETQTSAVP